jgi:hypothetical protein
MTHEVWLMFLGLNVDLWNDTMVDKVVSEFGKLIVWEEDFQNMARVFVKLGCQDLTLFPGSWYSLKELSLLLIASQCRLKFFSPL